MPNKQQSTTSNAALEPVTLTHETGIKLKEFSDYYIEAYSSPEEAKEELWDLLYGSMSNPDSVADYMERGNLMGACKRCMQMIDFMFQVGSELSLKDINNN